MSSSLHEGYQSGEHADVRRELETWATQMLRASRFPSNRWEDAVDELVLAGLEGLSLYTSGADAVARRCMQNALKNLQRRYRRREGREVPTDMNAEDYRENARLAAESHEHRIIEKMAASQQVDELLDAPWLSDGDKKVMRTMLECRGNKVEAARRLGLTSAALKQAFYRIRVKTEQQHRESAADAA